MTHPFNSTTDGPAQVNLQQYNARPDGHVNHGGPILERHDFRDWVEWPDELAPRGARVRREFVVGDDAPSRFYVHPDDVPTDPDAELVERVAGALAHDLGFRSTYDLHRTVGRGVIEIVRAHDKADR